MKLSTVFFCSLSALHLCNGAVSKKHISSDPDDQFIRYYELDIFQTKPSTEAKDRILEGVGKLTTSLLYDIYKRVNKFNNIVLSPVSIWSVLAMLLEGSGGKTEKELKEKLQLLYNSQYEGKSVIHSRYEELTKTLQVPNSPTKFFSLNYVISDKSRPLNPWFNKVLREVYGGQNFDVDTAQKEKYSDMINRWVKEVSGNQIGNIVTPDVLDDLVLIVGNAVYFKSTWKYPFDPMLTKIETFTDEYGRAFSKVAMMHQVLVLPHTQSPELESEILEIPYGDNVTSMIVILPHENVSLMNVLSKMKYLSLSQILPKNMSEETIQLSLPRFHISARMELNDFLKKDLPSVFNSRSADFSNLGKDLYVSKIKHKVEIENTEEGTTALGTTNVMFAYKISSTVFRANRPFVYLINEIKTRTILFAGTLTNPTT